jgi:hypothetical protein
MPVPRRLGAAGQQFEVPWFAGIPPGSGMFGFDGLRIVACLTANVVLADRLADRVSCAAQPASSFADVAPSLGENASDRLCRELPSAGPISALII